jgi:hypothetical protein
MCDDPGHCCEFSRCPNDPFKHLQVETRLRSWLGGLISRFDNIQWDQVRTSFWYLCGIKIWVTRYDIR